MIRQLSRVGLVADDFFRNWINAREVRLAERDRIRVCSFEWGMEALEGVPGFEVRTDAPELGAFRKANQWWLANKAAFFAYQTPREFQLHGCHLQFPSAVKSLYRENDTVFADYFHCGQAHGRAVLVLPHWNAVPNSYAGFCHFLNWLGFWRSWLRCRITGIASLASVQARSIQYRRTSAGQSLVRAKESSIPCVVWIG
jgi:hypothetical protein